MKFTESNSPTFLILTVLLSAVLVGASSLKILFTDLRQPPNVHNEVHNDIEVKVDKTTDCKFSLLNRCGGQD